MWLPRLTTPRSSSKHWARTVHSREGSDWRRQHLNAHTATWLSRHSKSSVVRPTRHLTRRRPRRNRHRRVTTPCGTSSVGRSTPSSHPGTPKTCHDESPQDRAAIAGDPPPFGGCSPDPPNGPPRATGRPLAAPTGRSGARSPSTTVLYATMSTSREEHPPWPSPNDSTSPPLPPEALATRQAQRQVEQAESRFDTETPAWGGVHPVVGRVGVTGPRHRPRPGRSASGSARPRTGASSTATPARAWPTGPP